MWTQTNLHGYYQQMMEQELNILIKINQLLESDDIEMVQLGARLMEEYLPKRMWLPILKEYSTETIQLNQEYLGWNTPPFTTTLTATSTGGYAVYPTTSPIKIKWEYKVEEERGIIITPFAPNTFSAGLWTQLRQSAYKPTHKIQTGQGGLNLIQGALSSYLNKSIQKPTQCQTKPKAKTKHKRSAQNRKK